MFGSKNKQTTQKQSIPSLQISNIGPSPAKQGRQEIGQLNYNIEKLRENFAEQLLNLELEIESPNLTCETVTQLLELYREAVEYYEAIQSTKYLIFKNKIQSLLTRRNVQTVMKMQIPKQALQHQSEPEAGTQKQKELQIRLNFIRGQDQSQQVENFICQEKEKEEKLNDLINQEIDVQQQTIQQRIQQRRNNSVKKESGKVYVVNQGSGTPRVEKKIDLNPETNQFSNHIPIIRSQGIRNYQYSSKNLGDQK